MSWMTYKLVAASGTKFTHFSKFNNLGEVQLEWEKKFGQKAVSIELDEDDSELDFSDLFEAIPEVK